MTLCGRNCMATAAKALMLVFAIFAACCARPGAARLAGECAMQCNDLRLEVLTLEICRYYNKSCTPFGFASPYRF